MTCLIYSQSNDIPIDFWNHVNLRDGVEGNALKTMTTDKLTTRAGNGFFVKIDGVVYVITCFHIIEQNNMKNTIYYYNSENELCNQNAILKTQIEEFDISVLQVENPDDINKKHIHDFEKLNCKISDINMNKLTYIKTMIDTSSDDKNPSIVDKKVIVNIKKISKKQTISSLIANHDIHHIDVAISTANVDANIKLNGLSGSLVFNMTTPIGIVMSGEKNVMSVMPMCFVKMIVSQCLNKKIELASLIVGIQVCDFDIDDEVKFETDELKTMFNKKTFYGLLVDDPFDVRYSYAENPENTKKHFMFHKGDIIVKINDDFIEDDALIYSDVFGCNINFGTYCMMSNYTKSKVNVYYLRKEVFYCRELLCTKLNDSIPYHLTKPTQYYNHSGFIYTELSHQLMEYYKQNNVLFCDDLNAIKSDNVNKYVVLVHIDYSYLKNEYKKGVDELLKTKFPYSNNKFTAINKIGNEIITDIKSLQNILTKKESNKQNTYNYYGSTNDRKKKNINIESNNDTSIIIKYC